MTWLKDKNQNWVNADGIFSLTVNVDTGSVYVVIGRDAAGNAITTFWNGANMTQAQAEDLRLSLVDELGAHDPTV